MPITTTWVSPAAAGVLDLATGSILTETWCDGVASDLLRLGGVTGQVTQTAFVSGSTVNPTTTSTSVVDLPDMTLTMTTTGGDVLVFLVCVVSNATLGAVTSIDVNMDVSGEVSAVQCTSKVANAQDCLATIARYSAPSAASHNWKGRWNVGSGTGTAVSVQRYMLAVELKR